MSLLQHAERELKLAGLFDKDSDYEGDLGKAVMELIDVFSKQRHSGASAGRVRQLFNLLADYNPLKPIMCDDQEWDEVSDNTFQNNRCNAVFKEGKDGQPYYLDAIVWKTQNGGTYTGSAEEIKSRQFINIPFTPKTFYVDVIETEVKPGLWDFKIKDREQLLPVWEYYKKSS